jgi:uncharacterized repeat protein (TIGR03803 family)
VRILDQRYIIESCLLPAEEFMLALHSSVRAVSKQCQCMASLFMAGPLATAQKETVLYTVCSQANCADGAGPYAGLITDKQGNLYGTTMGGGAYGFGTAFKISTSGTEMVLHSFAGGTDGAYPYSGLVMDKENNVYSTRDSSQHSCRAHALISRR